MHQLFEYIYLPAVASTLVRSNTHPNDDRNTPHIVLYLATRGSQMFGQLQDLFCWSFSAQAVQQLLNQLEDKSSHCNAWNTIVYTGLDTCSAEHVAHITLKNSFVSHRGRYLQFRQMYISHTQSSKAKTRCQSIMLTCSCSPQIRAGRMQDNDVCSLHRDRRTNLNQEARHSQRGPVCRTRGML